MPHVIPPLIWNPGRHSGLGRKKDSIPAPGSGSGTGCAGMTMYFHKNGLSNHVNTKKKNRVGEGRKPGSVSNRGYPRTDDDHSSSPTVTGWIKQPTRRHGRTILNASLFGLAPDGVYLAPAVTGGTGELLPRLFTLTCFGRRFTFCGTFLPVAGTGRYPASCPAEPGLSSPLSFKAGQRPSVLLRHA